MGSSTTAIDQLNWPDIAAQLDIEGYALLPGLLAPEHARDLARHTDALKTLRRVSLASSDLGRGELFYFDAGLPAPWSAWRVTFYRYLAPVANRWNETLGSGYRYPPELEEFQKRNRQAGETEPQSHLNRLRVDDYLALHQRHDGEHVFPLQIVGLLTEPGSDFQGGEFVMTEQRPRMQSRPMVLPLKLSDAAIISTAHRPFKGTKGFYRVNLKHAISRVRGGERIGVELSFHDTRWSQEGDDVDSI
ncbi:2OG-Fe(II) oxygenase [Paraburkholderia sediminicola]|uniref:2OG-Fe(II) oxygenase n=1 Tax=Paraburkholderia sediminicola TaxID=458836 RepID=UPI0038BCDA5C